MADHGKFVWYDLMTPDAAAAKAFYGEVLGFGTQGWDKGDYTMWANEKGPFGGLMTADAGMPAMWVGYTSVPDLDATVARCEELGGKILVPPTVISEGARFAMLADPQGAVFSAYSSTNPGDNDWDNPAPFSWAELNTTDWPAARDFYTDLFNWHATGSMSMDGSGSVESTYWMFGPTAEKSRGGMSNAAVMMKTPPHWLHYATVDDLDAAIERVKQHGGQLTNGPMPVPGGDRIAQCLDPQGAAFALYEEAKKS